MSGGSGTGGGAGRERIVCGLAELEEAGALAADLGDTRVAVFHHGGRVFALNETCPHRGGPLHQGEIEDGVVRCPWHGWQFDLATGVSPLNPRSRVAAYPARIADGKVRVTLPDEPTDESPDRSNHGSNDGPNNPPNDGP